MTLSNRKGIALNRVKARAKHKSERKGIEPLKAAPNLLRITKQLVYELSCATVPHPNAVCGEFIKFINIRAPITNK
jgi:hypothetical protein